MPMSIHAYLTLVEAQKAFGDGRIEIDEVDIGGGVEPDSFPDKIHKKDLSSDQLDLFKEIPSLEPNLPSNFKIVGRAGSYYVAEEIAPSRDATKDTYRDRERATYRCFVFIDKGEAMSYVSIQGEGTELGDGSRYSVELEGHGVIANSILVLNKFRGRNLGMLMFKWLLENVCDYIISDSLHTSAGVIFWKKLQNSRKFYVGVWNQNKYSHRRHRPGQDFNRVYNGNHLIPWVTLRGRESGLMGSRDDY